MHLYTKIILLKKFGDRGLRLAGPSRPTVRAQQQQRVAGIGDAAKAYLAALGRQNLEANRPGGKKGGGGSSPLGSTLNPDTCFLPL